MGQDTVGPEPVRLALRRLWTDHAIWTRERIIAAAGDAPAGHAGATAARLLRNQDDIGKAIATYYGTAAGRELTDLLRQHGTIAAQLADDARGGNDEKRLEARWAANAVAIAHFLGGANRYWVEKDVLDLLVLHLKLTKDEMTARLHGDWDAAISAFDDILTEITMLADLLFDGLAADFPERFVPAGAIPRDPGAASTTSASQR